MTKKIVYFLPVLFVGFLVGAEQPKIPPMPAAVTFNSVASIKSGIEVYSLMGMGTKRTWDDVSNQMYVLSLKSGKWVEGRPVPGVAGRLGSAAIGAKGQVFVFGGYVIDGQGNELTVGDANSYIPDDHRWYRAADLPIFYSTGDTRAAGKPRFVSATKRTRGALDASDYDIRPEFKPQPGDVVITKQRASAFYGTPLLAHLIGLGIKTLIVCGESTSGCVRASVVDAYSNGFHVVLVEECCFDRSELSHKVNLFDMHHKYADVMHLDEVIAHLEKTTVRKAG